MGVTAIVGGVIGAVGIGAGLYESSQSSSAQQSAADTQANAAMSAAQLQYKEFQQQQKNLQPWLKTGTAAVNQLGALMQPGGQLYNTNFTPQDFYANQDPGYAWDVQQGINALNASGAASGNYGSGNMATGLINYAENQASNEYQNAYNRWMNGQNTLYNRLAGVSGTGQVAGTQIGNWGMNAASNMGNLYTQAGGALAAGQVGSANAMAQGLQGAGNQMMGGFGAYMNYQNNQALMNAFNQANAGQGYWNNPNNYTTDVGTGEQYWTGQ